MEWLDQVALLMPRVISVFIYRGNVLDIPDLVFSCASLQELELFLNTCDTRTIIRPKSINLPSLKVLKLQDVYLEDDIAQKLFLGCPSLESLYLGISVLDFSYISSKVLKTLALEECWQFNHMQICCPCLISFNIECREQTGGISLKNTASLANVNISLQTNDDGDVDDLNILEGLSNVSILKLDLQSDELKVHCLSLFKKSKVLICTLRNQSN
ncbi:F-box/FBD/LRR-repeat protein [Carex littledalei]|uniref:F-box/FBD/LRR-repeat protein n=1 Tax=Carex littledalei TaxID=544730 RepID=A0A833V4V5_9POAL|nr:F-box/FBD/LRR-repeat protein [Carex littledalei]